MVDCRFGVNRLRLGNTSAGFLFGIIDSWGDIMKHFRSSIALAISAFICSSPGLAAGKRDFPACFETSDWDRKIVGCSRVLEDGNLPVQDRFSAYTHRGDAYRESGKYDLAMADFTAAKRLKPNDAYGFNSMGVLYTELGEFDRGISEFNEALRLKPNWAVALSNRASAWDDKGEYDRAIVGFTDAIRRDPKYVDAYHLRGVVWRNKGQYDRAIEDSNQALRLNPKFATSYSLRGEVYRLKGDLERALPEHNKAIQFQPKFPLSFNKRGDTYRYKGDFDRAFADYDQALRLEPGFIPAFTGRGLTFEKMGDYARARIEFEAATTSQSKFRGAAAQSALETARARLAAIDSGAPQPVIAPAPARASSANSIATPVVAAPVAVPAAKRPAGRRVALVIGNAAYKSVPTLANPQRDAVAMAKSLRAIGFDTVTLAEDTTREKLIDALRTFANDAEKAEWAMVYYAGHGIEINGTNYLIPVDAKLAADRDVQFEAVPLDQVMASIEGAKKLRLVVLDACRDNPFAPQMRRTVAPDAVVASTAGGAIGTRSIGRGLSEVKVTGATLVVYAAKHGQTALDGEGGNSPFAVALVQRMATPNVEINKVFRLVRDDVMEATAGRQEPYSYGSLPGREDFFFVAR